MTFHKDFLSFNCCSLTNFNKLQSNLNCIYEITKIYYARRAN